MMLHIVLCVIRVMFLRTHLACVCCVGRYAVHNRNLERTSMAPKASEIGFPLLSESIHGLVFVDTLIK